MYSENAQETVTVLSKAYSGELKRVDSKDVF